MSKLSHVGPDWPDRPERKTAPARGGNDSNAGACGCFFFHKGDLHIVLMLLK